MALIQISTYTYLDPSVIEACEIFQKEDNCWYVKWQTEIGEFTSDAHTGKIAARNYIDDINKEIIKIELQDIQDDLD